MFYIKPVFSKRASATTKLGEHLGSCLPFISNSGLGDTGTIHEGKNVAVMLQPFDEAAFAQEVQALLKSVAGTAMESHYINAANKYLSQETFLCMLPYIM